jgi:hypothetical protein
MNLYTYIKSNNIVKINSSLGAFAKLALNTRLEFPPGVNMEYPLMYAILTPAVTDYTIYFLIERGANLNIRTTTGLTPLIAAIQTNRLKLAMWFLQGGEYVFNREPERLLLRNVADPIEMEDEMNLTPLAAAAEYTDSVPLVKTIIKAIAVKYPDYDICEDIKLASTLARDRGHMSIVRYLKPVRKIDVRKYEQLPIHPVCSNYESYDMFETEQYKDIPFFTVLIDKKAYCVGTGMVQFMLMSENTVADWIKNPLSKQMSDQGLGGKPGNERFYKLTLENYSVYISHTSLVKIVKIVSGIDMKRYVPVFAFGKGKKMRLGNIQGTFGIGMLHGQLPGESVYEIEKVYINPRNIPLSFMFYGLYKAAKKRLNS